MKNYSLILLAIITTTTLLLFNPISAYTDWVITEAANNSYNDDYHTLDNGVIASDASIARTEQWVLILDEGQGSVNCTLTERQDGIITADGNWVYTYQGATVSGPYTNAYVSIVESSMSITATGTATKPSAPPGYNTSPFTLNISGSTINGQGNGTFTITFSAFGWPDRISGKWEGTRTSGRGITAESQAMPWLLLLLKD